MNPWWLRPTAEGAEQSKDQPAAQQKQDDDAKKGGGDGGRTRSSRGGSDRRRSRSRGDETAEKSDAKPDEKKGASSRRSRSRSGGERAKGERDKKGSAGKQGSGQPEKDDDKKKQRADGGRDDQKRNERSRGGRERKAKSAGNRPPDGGGKSNGGGKPDGNGNGGEGDGRERPREQYTFDDDVSHSDFAAIRREILSIPERNQVSDERKIALFCDLENVALGVRDSEVKKFDIDMVLERLLEKGKIIVKKAYCDWERYSEYKRGFHEAAIEMIDIPQKYYSGKNSADIKMVVDAMDLSFSKEHLDTFVILSGDSDFSPLVSKLKENNKYVIGIGVKGSSSNLLIDNCDEFIYYEDLWRDRQKAPKVDGTDSKKSEAFRLMVDAIQALLRDNKDVLWGSMIKQTMQRKKPSFSESYHGYSTFSELLEDAERSKLIKLKKDQRSGTYIVTGFAQR